MMTRLFVAAGMSLAAITGYSPSATAARNQSDAKADMRLATEAKIQPGALITTKSGSSCTLNWVYDGIRRQAGKVFVGTAAHCVQDVGQKIMLASDTSGEPLLTIGRVAFISPRYSSSSGGSYDYALIRVAKRNHGLVDASLKGHSQIPTGVSTMETAAFGDLVQLSGHGVGFHAHEITRERRVGMLQRMTDTEWSSTGPVIWGDSGGPLANVTDGNKALGVVAVWCVGTTCTGSGGPTVEAILSETAEVGFPIEVRTI